MKTYLTQDNGSEPFKVEITNNHVVVYNQPRKNDFDVYQHLITYDAVRVFVGKSPLNDTTAFSGGHGDKYDGNSILLELPNNLYVYIGCSMFSFTPKARIVSYVSPVGNNWVPYPYAVDELNNYYLMIEDVILTNTKTILDGDAEPYDYYYEHNKIFDYGRRRDSIGINPTRFMNITNYFINDEHGLEQYSFRYHPFTQQQRDWCFREGIKEHYIDIGNTTRIPLSEKMYWEIMAAFGKKMGFETLEATIIA